MVSIQQATLFVSVSILNTWLCYNWFSDHRSISLSTVNLLYRVNELSFSSFCTETTPYFRNLTKADVEEQIIDVVGFVVADHIVVEAFINVWHMKNCSMYIHGNYSLFFHGVEYANEIPVHPNQQHNHLRFSIQNRYHIEGSQIIQATLKDQRKGREYPSIHICIRQPSRSPSKLIACMYTAKQNSINEIRSWIAFYRLQKVDRIMVYLTDPMPQFYLEFNRMIKSGYLLVKDFQWPRNGNHGLIIHSNQEVQANHFFYTNRYFYQSVLLCDLDEYILSDKYPFDLPKAVAEFQRSNVTSIQIPSQYATNQEGDEPERDLVLANGTLFDSYPYRYTFKETRREKIIILKSFEGLVRVHDALFGSKNVYSDPSILRVHHFRRNKRNGLPSSYYNGSIYTLPLMKMIRTIR